MLNSNENDFGDTSNGESARPSLEPPMPNFGNEVGAIKKEFDDEDSEPRRLLIEMDPPQSHREANPPNSIVNEVASNKPMSECVKAST